MPITHSLVLISVICTLDVFKVTFRDFFQFKVVTRLFIQFNCIPKIGLKFSDIDT